MGEEASATPCRKPASHSLPPPPPPLRSRSRVADLGASGAAFSDPPDTPPRCSPVTVPFLWEEAPGKPKAAPPADAANAGGPVLEDGTSGEHQDSDHADQARPVPLKLPPRLQQVPATDMSPKTVLQSPYYSCPRGGRCKPPSWARSNGAAAFRRTTSSGVALFSRTWSVPKAASGSNNNRAGDQERDAPWCSPASSSSSSSVTTCFGGDGREICSEEDDDGSPTGLVRITRFTSLPSMSMTTSNLWTLIKPL